MDLRLLHIFCAVYEEASVSRAAKRLALAQPTVSEHLKSLEKQVGALLFDRLSRQIHPTRAGEHLYEQARRVGEVQRSITQSMARFLQKLEGKLVIGASTIPGEYILPALIGRYRERHPGVSVSLRIRDSRGILEDVEAGRIDAGFVGARLTAGPLEFAEFSSDRLVLAVPAGPAWKEMKSVALKDIMKLPLLVRNAGSGTRSTFEAILAKKKLRLADFNIIAELGSATAIKEAIKANVGCSILSDLSIVTEREVGLIRQVAWKDVPALRRDFYIVIDSRRSTSPLAEEFLGILSKAPRTRP